MEHDHNAEEQYIMPLKGIIRLIVPIGLLHYHVGLRQSSHMDITTPIV